MTTNQQKAADLIMGGIIFNQYGTMGQAVDAISQALADAGLLAQDLPEANDPTASFVPDGKGWLLTGQDGPVVWTVPGGLVMVQRLEPGELTPEQAREFAAIIHAAADHAEEVGRADS